MIHVSLLVREMLRVCLLEHAVKEDTTLNGLSVSLQVKLSGRTEQPSITWAGKGVLASASGEMIVR